MMKRILPLFLMAFIVCQYNKWDGWTIDRLIAGNIMKYNSSHSDYIEMISKNYPLIKPFLRDCEWGVYLKLNDQSGISPHAGLVIRF